MVKIPKKLKVETKRLIRLKLFLRECGLSKVKLSSEEIRELEKVVSR